LLALLNRKVSGDASLILTQQLIAALLNIAAGSDPAPAIATISDAQTLLAEFSGKLPYGVKTSSPIGQRMVADGQALKSYNLGY